MISTRAKNITPSLTLEISAKAKKMAKEGKSVVNFGVGEPDFNTPQYIIDAAKRALDEGFTKYTPASGMPELKTAICEKLKKDNGLIYEPQNIVVSCGGKGALYHAMAALLDEGDEVLLPVPYWLSYPEQIKLCGAKVIEVKGKNIKVTAKELENACSDKTKLLILNSPSNPTGAVYTKDEICEIAKLAEKKGFYVLSDEIYEKLVYGGAEHYSIASYSPYMKEHTIVCNGMSKTYSMTGWRIGYIACEKTLAKAVGSIQSHTTSNPTSFAQYASVAALNGGEKEIEHMKAVFEKRLNLILSLLKDVEGIRYEKPQGAFYVFIDVSDYFGKKVGDKVINGSLDFCDAGLEYGIALVPGVAFGDDKAVRISYAVSEEDIKLGLERFKNYLKKFQ